MGETEERGGRQEGILTRWCPSHLPLTVGRPLPPDCQWTTGWCSGTPEDHYLFKSGLKQFIKPRQEATASCYQEDGFNIQSSMATFSLRLHPQLLYSRKGKCDCKAQWVSRLLKVLQAKQMNSWVLVRKKIIIHSHFLQHTWHYC